MHILFWMWTFAYVPICVCIYIYTLYIYTLYIHTLYIYIIIIYSFIAGRISPHYLDGKNCNLLPRNGRDTHVRQIKARRMWIGHGTMGWSWDGWFIPLSNWWSSLEKWEIAPIQRFTDGFLSGIDSDRLNWYESVSKWDGFLRGFFTLVWPIVFLYGWMGKGG